MSNNTDRLNADTLLWEKFLQGDKDALGQLYKENYDLLFNYGMKCYADKDLIKDCIQDVFVRLYNSDNLNSTRYVRAYLLRSVRNMLYDKLASSINKEELDSLEFDVDIGVSDSELEKLFAYNDEDITVGKEILSAFKKLNSNQRMSIYLRFMKGFSYKEISNALDIKEQSAMNLCQRSLKKIRELLK